MNTNSLSVTIVKVPTNLDYTQLKQCDTCGALLFGSVGVGKHFAWHVKDTEVQHG